MAPAPYDVTCNVFQAVRTGARCCTPGRGSWTSAVGRSRAAAAWTPRTSPRWSTSSASCGARTRRGGTSAGPSPPPDTPAPPPGRAVQVDHIKPTLKTPGTKRLKLELLYDEPPSKFAFGFSLRRYRLGRRAAAGRRRAAEPRADARSGGGAAGGGQPLDAPQNGQAL